MEIPLIFVYGSELSVERLGWTARKCSRCRRVQAFECFGKWKTNHVYFIYGKTKSIGQILVCDFCETSIGLAAGSAEAKGLRCSRVWKKAEGLNALVEKTNPALGHVPLTDKPGRQELFALLESMNERANPYKIKSDPGMAMGMVIGAPAFALLGVVLSTLGLTGIAPSIGAMAGGFIGLFIGALVGAIKFKSDYSKRRIEELLLAAMQRHALTVSTLERALKHYPGELKYVSHGLTQLAAGA